MLNVLNLNSMKNIVYNEKQFWRISGLTFRSPSEPSYNYFNNIKVLTNVRIFPQLSL